MQNKKLIILIILSAGAVFSLTYGIITSPRTGRRLPSRVIARSGGKTRPVKRITLSLKRPRRSDYASWGRSPFMPPEVTIKEFTGLSLNGIVWDEENPKAIINGAIIGIGDKLGVNTIVDIKKDRVILNDGAADFELILGYKR